ITATAASPSVSRFGFEISPQNTAGVLKGTMTLTQPTRTQLVGTGKYITHTYAGTSGAGSDTWTFNWKAPVTGSGAVTFYGAFNFTNNNGSSSGDTIKLCQLTVSENLSASVDFLSENKQILLWPNPVQDIAHLSVSSNNTGNEASINIFDCSGKL